MGTTCWLASNVCASASDVCSVGLNGQAAQYDSVLAQKSTAQASPPVINSWNQRGLLTKQVADRGLRIALLSVHRY